MGLDAGVSLGIHQLIAGDAEERRALSHRCPQAARRHRSGRFLSLYRSVIFFSAAAQRFGSSLRYFSTCWSMAVFMNMARIMGAGPLMVMDTEVEGAQRSKPE